VHSIDDEKEKLGCMKRIHRIKCKFIKVPLALLLLILLSGLICNAENQLDLNQLPVKDMVTMIDLGAKKCIPCKMMAPIMEKMEKQYEGKAAIVFIDVWENKDQAGKYGVRVIPTQIFYDADGKETYRHIGFLGEKAIVGILQSMGIEPEE
jgi:thioredoxin 1